MLWKLCVASQPGNAALRQNKYLGVARNSSSLMVVGEYTPFPLQWRKRAEAWLYFSLFD
jgi:hypothetical protein